MRILTQQRRIDMKHKPSKDLKESVQRKDIKAIKESLVDILKHERNNYDNFYAALRYVESKNMIDKITDTYKLIEAEKTKERNEWDKSYYLYKTFLLEDNFALKERLPHIKEIGKVVFADEESQIKETETNSAENPEIAPSKNRRSKKKNTISIGQAVGVIAATAAIIGAIIWIIKAFR